MTLHKRFLIIETIFTLNPCSQKIKEPTLNHISFACSYMKANGSLKIFKNPKLEVLLSLNIMKKIQRISYLNNLLKAEKDGL
jgi:hypothetical protein